MRTHLGILERVCFGRAREVLCAGCRAVLDRHLPDEGRPDRLLGTCGGCGAWYLIDLTTGVMIVLPVSGVLGDP